MPELDAESLVDQVTLLGLVSREQLRQAMADAGDASPDTALRMLLRKGWLTSWQIERLKKGDPTGFFFGDSKVLFHLAEGTFARVYRGQHISGGGPVAIKVLRQRFAQIPEAVQRFHKEAEAGMRLDHTNIVRVIDVGQQDNRHYMIMEYVEGMNLRDFLKLRVRLKAQTALPLMLGLSRALKYSLEKGVTHRDIKGTNILISNKGEAKLVDFGLATMEGDDNRQGVKSQRTVDYSALERTCNSPKGDPRSDIYFLGCVFYQMLTGQLPMEEAESKDLLKKMLKRSFGAIKPISDHPYAPDEELASIIEKMMKVDLKARFQSMDDVVAALERYEASLRASAGPAGAGEAASRPGDLEFESIFALPPEPSPTVEGPGAGAGTGTPEAGEAASRPDVDLEFEAVFALSPEPSPTVAGPGAGSGAAGAQAQALPFEVKAVVQKTVLCVEAQDDIQDVLRKSLSRMGYRVLLVGDAERAAERYREAPVDAVIFDTDGQGAESIKSFLDMHDKAHEDGHQLLALVLLGPRQGALREKLPADDRVIVLSKPLKMKDVQESIHRLLPAR
jgi:tRNA A-37 threonylcarbamoyl transferase component Bud32